MRLKNIFLLFICIILVSCNDYNIQDINIDKEIANYLSQINNTVNFDTLSAFENSSEKSEYINLWAYKDVGKYCYFFKAFNKTYIIDMQYLDENPLTKKIWQQVINNENKDFENIDIVISITPNNANLFLTKELQNTLSEDFVKATINNSVQKYINSNHFTKKEKLDLIASELYKNLSKKLKEI